jgi:hypothetical protein
MDRQTHICTSQRQHAEDVIVNLLYYMSSKAPNIGLRLLPM